ncbi:Cytochrome c-554 [Myxococcaceae bacterium]|jgi:peroxiredoxin|nr:Cytochrome c-554 [Myxococcaceae bacterium]
MLARVRARRLLGLLAPLLVLACGEAGEPGAALPATPAKPAEARPAASTSEPKRTQRPLPSFEGVTLEGEKVSGASLLGKRALLFLFNPEVPDAVTAAKAISPLSRLRGSQNFEIVGVAAGSDRKTLESFVKAQGIDYRVIDDPSGTIARKLGLPVPVALIGADAEGGVTFGLGQFPKDGPDPVGSIEGYVRQALRLPEVRRGVDTALGERPVAPTFGAERLEGGPRFDLASLRGKPVVLIFFLHTCPHCHHELEFLKAELPKIPENVRPVLIGVSVLDHVSSVKATLAEDGLDFFPVLLDSDYSIRTAYGAMAGVPETFLIDREGRIVARMNGWGQPQDEPLLRMRLAKLAGTPIPMLLSSNGYSGNEFCAVCHEGPAETWSLTAHAGAFATLVRHGADKDSECVGCHVVGWGKPGGYTISPPTPHLENVGCENCHGRGGPHQSPGFVAGGDFAPACATCHNEQHSLGFDYASFVPKVGCRSIAKLAELPRAEKERILESLGRPREPILGNANASFMGSEACRSCHAAEYATWAGGAHARSIASLEKKEKAADPGCLRCHVTGFGRPGGFPKDGTIAAHPDLARVGCEDCHGPGSEHVAEGASRRGTIVSLGDKCKSCAILQVCGTCHDDANDPGFRFEVEKKIEAQAHGTIEAGTGRPKSPGAALRRLPAATPESEATRDPKGVIERVFRLAGAPSRAAGPGSAAVFGRAASDVPLGR